VIDSEEAFTLINFVRNSILPMAIFDKEMRCIAQSRPWQIMYQLTDEGIGKFHYDVLVDIPAHWKKAHEAALKGRVVEYIEEPFRLANGAKGWHRWQCYPWHRRENEIAGIIISAEDITARKDREIELNKVLARFELIQQAAVIGMWDWDIDQQNIVLNEQFFQILGFETGVKITQHDFLELIHDDDRSRVIEARNTALMGGADFEVEFRITRRNDGKLRWIKDQGFFEFNDDMEPVRGYGAIIDITRQKLVSAEQIKEIAEQYESFLNSMLEGVWSVDRNGITIYVNEAMAQMLGYTQEEILGKSVISFIPSELREDSLRRLAERSSGKSERDEYPLKRKDGSTIWSLFGAKPIYDNNEYIGSVAVVFDYSSRKNALLEKERRIEELERILELRS